MVRRSLGMGIVVATGVVAIASCGSSGRDTVDVLAASSFTDVAPQLEMLLESELGVDVKFSFGSSGSFFEQLQQGSPASVVITANESTMERMVAAGLVDPSSAIARNRLTIVTADTDAGRAVSSVSDLGSGDAVVVLCASSAPCGAASDEMLARAGVIVTPASREPNVRATLTKVRLGEADAAVVYRTDALATPELRSVEIADSINVSVTSEAAAVTGSSHGSEIVGVLASPAAGEILHAAGFESP